MKQIPLEVNRMYPIMQMSTVLECKMKGPARQMRVTGAPIRASAPAEPPDKRTQWWKKYVRSWPVSRMSC